MTKIKKSYIVKGVKNPKNALYVAKVNLDNIGSRLFFKNTAGFKNNLRGQKLEKSIKKSENYVNRKHNQNIFELRKNGFTDLKYPFDESIITEIKKKYEKLIDDDDYSFVRSRGKDGKVYSRMINEAYKVFPEIKNLISKEISEMVKEHYQSNFQIIHVQLWRTYHVPQDVNNEKEMFGSNWHCDGANTAITTMFVNMSKVTQDNGPLHFQSIERTKELIKLGYKSRHSYNLPLEMIEDPNHVLKHIGSIGSTVWVNTQFCLHRAGIPIDGGYRDMMQLRFIPSNESLHDDWINRCEPSNDEIRFNDSKHVMK